MEHGGVGQVGVAAVDLAGSHDGQGRLAAQHGTHLHGRGVGAHEHALGDVEGVLHVAGGMFRRHVEGLEIVEVVFHFRAGSDVEAQLAEDAADLFHHQGGGVQRTAPGGAAGQGGVEALEGLGFAGRFQGGLAGVEQGGEALLDAVGLLTHGGAFRGGQLGHGAHGLGQFALAAQKVHPQFFQFIQRRSPVKTCFEVCNQAFQYSHQIHANSRSRRRRRYGQRDGPDGRTQQRRRDTMSRRHTTTGRMPPGPHAAASGARPILPESPAEKKSAAYPARGKTSRQDMPRTQKSCGVPTTGQPWPFPPPWRSRPCGRRRGRPEPCGSGRCRPCSGRA